MVTVNITYQIITEESAAHGDFKECGFIDESLEFETKEQALKYFHETYGEYEQGNQSSYYTVDADKDIQTGEETYYGLHFD